jgi:hypothetical protein
MLLSGIAEITGGDSAETGFVARARHAVISAVAVVGRPPVEDIVRATEGVTSMTPLLAQVDNSEHVGEALARAGDAWRPERVILHVLRSPSQTPPEAPDMEVRLLERGDRLDHLPPGLRYEMTHAQDIAPVCAVFVRGVAASFCYPCWKTETLWDVSVDTLETHRGRALGQRAVDFMIAHMRREGREPVWAALASNRSSLTLADKLGFAAIDAMVCFSRGPWAFLTAGFDERSA